MRTFLILLCWMLALPSWAKIDISETVSAQGIKAWYISDPSIPMVSLEIGFKGGPNLDPKSELGASYLMTGLLEEGAGARSDVAFKTALEEIAAEFSFDTSRDGITISATFLKDKMPEALALLDDAINRPRFDAPAVERVRAQVVSILKSRAQDPNDIATDAFFEQAYPNHPYARPYRGSLESIDALTVETLKAAHARAFTKDRLFVSAVGDITEQELQALLDQLFGDLPDSNGLSVADITFKAKGGISVIDYPTPQSVAYWGHEGITQDDPDFFAAFVMNHILGAGGFSSRLTNEIREKRGLTYGVSSFLAGLDHAQFIGGQIASQNARIGETIPLIKAEWVRMATEGVTEQELRAAKDFMTGSYALRFDGNAAIASILLFSQMDGYPIDYPATRNDRVEAVTQEEIAQVAKRLLREDDIRFVIVGQPEGVDPTE